MPWKFTTYMFLATILIWTAIDFQHDPPYPHRWALWILPVLDVCWVGWLTYKY